MTRRAHPKPQPDKFRFPMTVRFIVTLGSDGRLKYDVHPADADVLARAIAMRNLMAEKQQVPEPTPPPEPPGYTRR